MYELYRAESFLRTDTCSADQEILRLIKTEGSLPCSEDRTNGPYS